MNTTRITLATAAALTTVAALAGCASTAGSSSGSSGEMSGMDMSSSSSTPSAAASAAAKFNSADVMFAQMMVVHHMQAIEMADMVLAKKGVDPKVTDLAKKIKQAQTPEIDQMNGFLASYGKPKVTSPTMSSMSMGGMSAADMEELKKASGATASKLFLTQMTKHHSSAVSMAQTEVENGKDPAAVALAKRIVEDQTAEIAVMKKLLTQL